jgi:hypothetical protein
MWRLLLSGLFCLPALGFLLFSKYDSSLQISGAAVDPSVVATSDAAPSPIHMSLPPVRFSTEQGLRDPVAWESAGLPVGLPLQGPTPGAAITTPPVLPPIGPSLRFRYVAMQRHTLTASGHTVAEFVTASKGHRASDQSRIPALPSRNMTIYSFALPDQNGGG